MKINYFKELYKYCNEEIQLSKKKRRLRLKITNEINRKWSFEELKNDNIMTNNLCNDNILHLYTEEELKKAMLDVYSALFSKKQFIKLYKSIDESNDKYYKRNKKMIKRT